MWDRPFCVNETVLLPVVTSTRPGRCRAAIAYRAGLISPSGRWAIWTASATTPANSGVASLVPQVGYQPAAWPPKLSYTSTAPSQAALIEMSGTPRARPTTFRTRFWYDGREKKIDFPPPPASGLGSLSPLMNCCADVLYVSFHTLSGEVRLPFASRCSWVPPTLVTRGSVAGQFVTRAAEYVGRSSPRSVA